MSDIGIIANLLAHLQEMRSTAFLSYNLRESQHLEVLAMHRYPTISLAPALLILASISIAQEPYHTPDPGVLARLSYGVSRVVEPGKLRHVCIAVSSDGEYRIVRTTGLGLSERLHGKMPAEEFKRLSELLGATEFRGFSGYHGGIIRQEAQTFGAEIPKHDPSQLDRSPRWPGPAWRLQWMDGDGRNPFPAAVSSVVDWMKQFQPTNGKAFEYAEYPDVCPAAGFRLLQPSVAENSHP